MTRKLVYIFIHKKYDHNLLYKKKMSMIFDMREIYLFIKEFFPFIEEEKFFLYKKGIIY